MTSYPTVQSQNHDTLMSIVPRPDAVMVRGVGSTLWDSAGREYLDFIQGWAVNALGHAAPEVVDTLAAQAARLITPSPALHNAPLARVLTAASGLAQAHFCNSGAEANEVAVKLARKWGRLHRSGTAQIVTTHGGFHGRTLTMMAASGKPGWDQLFPPAAPGFERVPFGDSDAMRAAITPETAAIMVEPIQGEAGVVVPPRDYLASLRAIADEQGVLLILDEIQTGMGRTGQLFGFQHAGIRPDILTLGKGLGGGVPISAVVATEHVCCFEPGDQGGTYNGNPLMTAVANAVFEAVSQPQFLMRVRQAGDRLSAGLTAIAERHGAGNGAIRVRGAGLLWALVLPSAGAGALAAMTMADGLLVNPAQADVLRLMPSLRVTDGEIDRALDMLDSALARSTRAANAARHDPGDVSRRGV